MIVGAGTTELLGLIGQSLREVLDYHAQALGDPTKPLSHLVDPTYAEYRRVSKHNETPGQGLGRARPRLGCKTSCRGRLTGSSGPATPTTRPAGPGTGATLAKFVDETLGLLTIVNESSLPFLSDEAERTMIEPASSRENLLVLRSFSNFYALPGLRVGYAIGPPDMITRLRQYQDPWSVPAHAEAAALAALDDGEFRERTLGAIAGESARLVDRLWDLPGLRPAWPDRERPASAPPLPQYVLVSLTQTDWDSIGLQEALARRGCYVRECSDFPNLEVGALLTGPDQLVATRGHIRLAVRGRPEDDRLLGDLADLLASGPGD